MDANNKMERVVAALNFSTHQGTWFDMWHTSMDWDGRGNENPDLRRTYLLETIKAFDTYVSKMENYPRPYQAWILVDASDSSEDAIYIHAPDPHGESPYPFSIGLAQQEPLADDAIGQLFSERNFVRYIQPDHNDMYFFQRPGIGEPLS